DAGDVGVLSTLYREAAIVQAVAVLAEAPGNTLLQPYHAGHRKMPCQVQAFRVFVDTDIGHCHRRSCMAIDEADVVMVLCQLIDDGGDLPQLAFFGAGLGGQRSRHPLGAETAVQILVNASGATRQSWAVAQQPDTGPRDRRASLLQLPDNRFDGHYATALVAVDAAHCQDKGAGLPTGI